MQMLRPETIVQCSFHTIATGKELLYDSLDVHVGEALGTDPSKVLIDLLYREDSIFQEADIFLHPPFHAFQKFRICISKETEVMNTA